MSVRPQPPNQRENKWPESRARRSRRAAGALRSGRRADAVPTSRPVPFGRARAALGSLGARPGWMRMRMRMRSPSRGPRRRCEPRPPGLACLAGKAIAKSRRGTDRDRPRPPVGRWDLAARWFVRGPAAPAASGRPATCRSWTLTGSLSGSQGPPVARAVHGVESCGCGRRTVRFFSSSVLVMVVSSKFYCCHCRQ